MSKEKNIREDILNRAEILLHYNNLLIKQSDSWLSEKEGMKNIEKQVMERRRKGKVN